MIERLESRQLLSVSPAAIKLIPTVPHRMVVQETEGAPFTGATIATFTADPSGTYSATINWGDKTAIDTGTVVSNRSGTFSVEGSHDYARAGTFVATVKITNQSNKTNTVFSAVKVADAPLAASPIGMTRCGTRPFRRGGDVYRCRSECNRQPQADRDGDHQLG